MAIYEIPNSVQHMFEQGETSYRILEAEILKIITQHKFEHISSEPKGKLN